MAGEKTEKATPKRRTDERKKGNVLQSKDLATVFSLICLFYFMQFMMPTIVGVLKESISYYINNAMNFRNIKIDDMFTISSHALVAYAICAIPILLFAGAVAIVSTGVQTRFLVSSKLLKPKFSRMNPISGIGKMFSLKAFVELVKSLIKICCLIYIIYSTLEPKLYEVPILMDMSFNQSMVYLGESIMSVVFNVAIAFVFVGILDYAYQWFDFEKNIRMSKQDIKEEYKMMEGDPQIKAKIKERQRQMSQRRMMQDVPNADVIIRNPTHYAIAIQYDAKKNKAPVILAKGMDSLALKIIAVGKEHDIMITENRALAKGLYDAVEIQQEIPGEFYQSVAEILAFVYQIKKKGLS